MEDKKAIVYSAIPGVEVHAISCLTEDGISGLQKRVREMNWNYEEGRIYSKNDKNELMAEVTFEYIEDNEVNINHTYVNPVLRGQGIAGEILTLLAKYLRENGLKATATCSYASSWLNKHREAYSEGVIGDRIK